MASTGYSLEEIAGDPGTLQGGQDPDAGAPQPHPSGPPPSAAWNGRAHLRQGRGGQRVGQLQGPARQPVCLALQAPGLPRRDSGHFRQLRRGRGGDGRDVGAEMHRPSRGLRFARRRATGDNRKGPGLRGLWGRGVADDGRSGALLRPPALVGRDRLFQCLPVHAVLGGRHPDLGLRGRHGDRGPHRQGPDCRGGHPRRRRQRDRHRARTPSRRMPRHQGHRREREPAGVEHGQRPRFQPEELHHRAHRIRSALPDQSRPYRRTVQRGPGRCVSSTAT